MADISNNMNLPSNSTTSVLSNVLNMMDSLIAKGRTFGQVMSGANQSMGGVAAVWPGNATKQNADGTTTSKFAPDPVWNIPKPPESTQIAAGPNNPNGGPGGSSFGAGAGGGGGGGNSLSSIAKSGAAGAVVYGAGAALGMANATSDMVQAQLLTQRAMAFMSSPGSITAQQAILPTALRNRGALSNPALTPGKAASDNAFDYASQAAMSMARIGAPNDKMDPYNAMAMAQQLNVAGPNYLMGAGGQFGGSVAAGIANVSNLTPGAGLEGTTSAYGAMQRARNVNMLRGVGINIRDMNGNLKPPDEVIDDLWKKIVRDYSGAYGSGKTPSKNEVIIAFEPGNSLDSLVNNLFGSDPLLYNLIKNGLMFKASTGGASIAGGTALEGGASDILKIQARTKTQRLASEAGFTTDATQAFSTGNAIATQGLGLSMDAGSGAFAATKNALTAMGNAMNTETPELVKNINALAAVMQTLGSAGNNIGGNFMSTLAGLIGKRAAGGPTDAQNMYLVGEKGPELFVPKIDGTIIPNDKLPFNYGGARAAGGDVFANGGEVNGDEFFKDVLGSLGAPVTDNNLVSLRAWAKAEGGLDGGKTNTRNSAFYNPFSTTMVRPGATSINSVGVKSYKTRAQGLEATVATLNLDYYKDVVNALKAGNVSLDEFETIVGDSPWGTWGGKGTTSKNTSLNKAISSALNSTFGGDYADLFNKYFDASSGGDLTLSNLLNKGIGSDAMSKAAAGLGSVYNYGGVAFNLNVAGLAIEDITTMIKGIIADMNAAIGGA